MKLFKNIILFTAAVLFAACQTDVETPQLYNPENFVAPVISECGDIIVNADNSNSENVIFHGQQPTLDNQYKYCIRFISH